MTMTRESNGFLYLLFYILCMSVCVAEWLRSPPLTRKALVQFPEHAFLTQAAILPRSVEWTAISKQWVTAVEDCECKPQVWEERWPLVLVQIHLNSGLTDMSTVPQIRVLNYSWTARTLHLNFYIFCVHNCIWIDISGFSTYDAHRELPHLLIYVLVLISTAQHD